MVPQGASPALEAVLLCAAPETTPRGRERVRERLGAEALWDEFVALARKHGLLPLIAWNLAHHERDLAPDPLIRRLDADFRLNLARNMNLASELVAISDLLKQHAIPAIPIKGVVVAAAVYGSIALRPTSDLDILVHRQHARHACDLLSAQGFALQTATGANGYPSHPAKYEFSLLRRQPHLLVELRWRVSPEQFPKPLAMENLWPARQTVEILGLRLPATSMEETLLLLAIHGAKHSWSVAMWIRDIAQIVHAFPELDWAGIEALARRYGAWRCVCVALTLAHRLFETRLPPSASTDRETALLTDHLIAALCLGQPPVEQPGRTPYYVRIMDPTHQRRYWVRHSLAHVQSHLRRFVQRPETP